MLIIEVIISNTTINADWILNLCWDHLFEDTISLKNSCQVHPIKVNLQSWSYFLGFGNLEKVRLWIYAKIRAYFLMGRNRFILQKDRDWQLSLNVLFFKYKEFLNVFTTWSIFFPTYYFYFVKLEFSH